MIEFLTILFIGAFLVAIVAFGLIIVIGLIMAVLAPVVAVSEHLKKNDEN